MDENNQSGTEAVTSGHSIPKHTGSDPDMPSSKSTKSPAFQFYPRDFLASHNVDRMAMTERGAYITLLARDWLDGGVPTDLDELASMCRMKPSQFRRMWSNGRLSRCFTEKNGRFFNDRLEVERRIQSAYSKRQKEKAEKRWGSDAVALPHPERGNASHPHPLPRSRSHPRSRLKKSAEPHGDSTPVVFVYPTVGDPSQWELRQAQIDKWVALYPNVNIDVEARKALGWLEANAHKRKTARGMATFLVGWFGRAADRGGSSPPMVVGGSLRTAGNADSLGRFAGKGKIA